MSGALDAKDFTSAFAGMGSSAAFDPTAHILKPKEAESSAAHYQQAEAVGPLVKQWGLTPSDVLAIRTFTLKNYEYINPAVAGDDQWMWGQTKRGEDPTISKAALVKGDVDSTAALVKGKERCTLLVHPDDAARLDLTDGGRARVRSRVGELVAPVQVTDEVMPGVVSLPHGFGHDLPGMRLQVAGAHAGVNVNLLSDPEAIDAPSGNAAFNGLPVQVSPST